MSVRIAVFTFLLFSPAASWACASCGCTLSSNWEDSTQSGFKLDLRYDLIDQDQLRSGTSTISPAAASRLANDGNAQEVELYTQNTYLTASAEYALNPDWKISLQVPYIIRHHSTLGTGSDGETPAAGAYTSNTSFMGDIKLISRYQGFSEQHNWGFIFGVKLPTGTFSQTGTSNDPTAPGAVLIDRGLQSGTGTTDVILGAFYSDAVSKNWDYFAEALYQYALDSRDEYRPGNGFNLNVGLRYLGLEDITPQIQVNARVVQHDSGANSDTISTGGTLLYLSPGLIGHIDSHFEAYTFVQLPLYQNLLGVQLAPTYTASLGARYMF